MVMLSKVAMANLLLLSPFAIPDAVVHANPDEATFEPYEDIVDISNTLIVSLSSMDGLVNIQNHVKNENGRGKGINVKGFREYRKPQKMRGNFDAKDNKGGGGGGSGGNRGGNSDNKVGNGNSRNKGKIRYLQEEDLPASVGYAVIETMTEEDKDAEAATVSTLPGVIVVENAHLEKAAEVRGLRGDGVSHAREIMEALAKEQNDEVEYAPTLDGAEHRRLDEANAQRRLAETTPYGIEMLNVTHLWAIEPRQHVKICVIDTGYSLGHVDLPSVNVTGWNPFIADFGVWNVDENSHGTHCAGTIGAIGSNGVGVVGVNPDPTRFSFHIAKGLSDAGSGSSVTVLEAVNDCVNQGSQVISMSLGSTYYSAAADGVYRDAYDAGSLVIAAAGNSGRDGMHYPSGYESVMSVASVKEGNGDGTANYGELSSFSTRNDQTEIAGPGHFVESTVPENRYGFKSGTSMATPHVAGVAALLISHFPDCTVNQIRNAMIHSTREPPTGDSRNSPGWDKYYGWGIVNAGNAYELLLTGCEAAGGAYPSTGETVSDQALGGKFQKDLGCTTDAQCADSNLCSGQRMCNLQDNTCYTVADTMPDCDDGLSCTIDTCDSTKPIINDVTDMCVHTPKTCEDGNMCNGVQVCQEPTGTCVISTSAISCDDSDACTIDTCNPSTGACSHDPLTCDDGNACTSDTCNPLTGCVFQRPASDCCGNAECESNESPETCPQDCSDSITTSLDPNVARRQYRGSIFQVVAKSKNMTITGMGLHCTMAPGVTGQAKIYTKPGDYYANGVWYKPSLWNLVYEGEINGCAGDGKVTNLSFIDPVEIPNGATQAFNAFINSEADSSVVRNIYSSGGRYSVYKEDSYLQILTGSGNRCTVGFCSITTPMAFSGTIYYISNDDNQYEQDE